MDTETTKRVNELVVSLCNFIEATMKSDSAADHEQLPSLIEALAKLIQ